MSKYVVIRVAIALYSTINSHESPWIPMATMKSQFCMVLLYFIQALLVNSNRQPTHHPRNRSPTIRGHFSRPNICVAQHSPWYTILSHILLHLSHYYPTFAHSSTPFFAFFPILPCARPRPPPLTEGHANLGPAAGPKCSSMHTNWPIWWGAARKPWENWGKTGRNRRTSRKSGNR